MMREVRDVPVEVLAALTTDWCQRAPTDDGEVARIGRWVVLRSFDGDEDCGDRLVVSTRAFEFENVLGAIEALDLLLDGSVV